MKRRAGKWVAAGFLLGLLFPAPVRPQTGTKTLDELLRLDMGDLLNMKVVSAIKGPETMSRVPATVRVITADQIRDNGYLTLEEALADLPGFQFRDIIGFNSYAFLRGVPSQNNKILVLMDGIQINELNSGGYYGGGQYNLSNVERIEVVFGPASALYGTNAVSGIINLISRDPKDTPGGRARVLIGGHDTQVADAGYSSYDPRRDLGFALAAMVKHSGRADLGGAAGDHNWTDRMETFENDASLEARLRIKGFTAGFVLQDKDASYATTRVTAPGAAAIPVGDAGVNWHIRFLNLWAAYNRDLSTTWSIRSTVYYRNATVLDDTIPIIELPTADSAGRQYRYYRPNHLLGGEAQARWTPSSRWHVSFGLVLETERLAQAISITQSASASLVPAVPVSPAMSSYDLASFYAQSRTLLSKSLELFLGLRHDASSYYGAVTTPRLGLVFNRDRLTAKILFGRAFRAPRPWDFSNGLGNPDLKPETISSWESSFGWSFSPSLRFELCLYRNRLTNLIIRENLGDDWRWINSGLLATTGGEASLEYRKGRLRAYLTYSYTGSVDDDGAQVADIAPHGATMGILYVLSPAWRLSLRGQYLGERTSAKVIPATGGFDIDAAWIVRAALTYAPARGLSLQLAVENALDAVYYHPSILPPSRYRQPQRSIRLSAGYGF